MITFWIYQDFMDFMDFMNLSSKIYVAGHRGLVGSAIVRTLQAQGYNNLILRAHKELDLLDQKTVTDFFQIAVVSNLIHINRWYSTLGAVLIIIIEIATPIVFHAIPHKKIHLLTKIRQGSYLASIFYLYSAAIII